MNINTNIKQNVSEIKRLFHERKEASQALLSFLISKGISPIIAEKILCELEQEGKEIGNVKEAVARRLRVAGELDFQHPHKLVFIGPTGVGKTTTILKLAEHYIRQNKKIALMTLDELKKGVLEEWSRNKEIPFFDNLKSSHSLVDLLLIDSEGCNFYLPNRIDDLGEKMAELGEGIEIVLTLSAAAKDVDLYGAVHQFSPLCPSTLTFTKIDETLAPGVLVNVCVKTDMPIRFIAYGYPLPGEVQIADAKSITHKILTDFNKEEFQFLRHL